MKGLLLTMTEPTPEMAAKFNAWYDTEHMAEHLAYGYGGYGYGGYGE